MSLKTCHALLEANAELKPSESEDVYTIMKDIVWTLLSWYCTGFCVHKDGYIITSAYSLFSSSEEGLYVRNFKDHKFVKAQRILDSAYDRAGIAVLKIDRHCDFGTVGDVSGLNIGTNVFTISHAGTLCYTFYIGRIVSALKTKSELTITNSELLNYINDDNCIGKDMKFLHIYGFLSDFHPSPLMQALGAPIFNSKGQIVGMIAAVDRGFEYAVQFTNFNRIISGLGAPKPYRGKEGSSSSSSSKRSGQWRAGRR